MARTSKETAPVVDETAQVVNETAQVENTDVEAQENKDDIQEMNCKVREDKDIPANVLSLMKLYPQYEEFYVTPNGFVHPAGVPEYLRRGATLYKNKFFNK